MRKRKILIFQHVPFEPLGTLDPMLREAGLRLRYINFGRDPQARPSLKGYSGLIVLGGPMNVDQTAQFPYLDTEMELIREACDRQMQVLGICLGAQLLARSFAAPVSRNPVHEIGWYDLELTAAGVEDELLSQFSPVQKMFQWHGDGFEVPDEGICLARSAISNQAFRIGDNAYGFQFHMEVDHALIERWLTLPDYARQLQRLDYIDPEQIRVDTVQNIEMLNTLSKKTFGKWIERFGLPRQKRLLHSR